jgi:hypothetical protein
VVVGRIIYSKISVLAYHFVVIAVVMYLFPVNIIYFFRSDYMFRHKLCAVINALHKVKIEVCLYYAYISSVLRGWTHLSVTCDLQWM